MARRRNCDLWRGKWDYSTFLRSLSLLPHRGTLRRLPQKKTAKFSHEPLQLVPPAPPRDATAIARKNTAKVSHEPLQLKEGKPYLALIGQTFDVWGVVDVIGDTRSHIAVKDVPAAIIKRTGMANFDGIAAFDRKLVLAHTKGFHELPRKEAFDAINTLGENLMEYVDEMKERLDAAAQDAEDDPKWLRKTLRDTKNEFTEYWTEDLHRFRSEVLPEASMEYRERRAVAASPHATPTSGEDDDYGAFVERIWAQAEIALPELAAQIDNERCFIVSLASRHGGSVYVNARVAGEKKTFVADRHHWRFGDAEIDASAFVGVMSGAPVDIAFSADPPSEHNRGSAPQGSSRNERLPASTVLPRREGRSFMACHQSHLARLGSPDGTVSFPLG